MIFRELKRAAQMWIFLVDYGDDGRPLFAFIPNQRCNQDFNETILETLSMSEKALKMLLNISGNVNAAARVAWAQPFDWNLRLEFNINFIHQGMSFCMLKDTFLNSKSQ